MDIKLEGKIPFTNPGWLFLLKKDKESNSRLLYETHKDRFPSGKSFPQSNPKHMKWMLMLLAHMPASYRDHEIQHFSRWGIDQCQAYMSYVNSWSTLTNTEKRYMTLNLCRSYDEGDNLLASNLFVQLFKQGIEVCDFCAKNAPNMEEFFLGQLLVSDEMAVRDYAVKHLTEKNRLVEYQSLVDMLRKDGLLSMNEDENIELLIQQFRNGKKFPDGRALAIIRENKERFVDALDPKDPVFQFYSDSKEFGYASLLYVERHGLDGIRAIVERNRNKAGQLDYPIDMMEYCPYLEPAIHATDLLHGYFIREEEGKYYVNMRRAPGRFANVKYRKYSSVQIKKMSELFNHLNLFIEADSFITERGHHYHGHVVEDTTLRDGIQNGTLDPYFALTLIVGSLHYDLMLPLGLTADTVAKAIFASPSVFKATLKEYSLQSLFDGKVLRKIKEDTSWDDLASVSEWSLKSTDEKSMSVCFDEMNILF